MSKLICDKCGKADWKDGHGHALLSDPPIYVDEYICVHCGAMKEVRRAQTFPRPHEVTINDNDVVRDIKVVKTDALTFDIDSGVYSDIYYKPTGDGLTISGDFGVNPSKKK